VSFLAPLFLLLGAAAAVPLLLHLMRRNVSARVDFPAARYLQRAEQEHSRSLRLRNLLLMVLRVLLILALALAAARPFTRGVGVGVAHGATAVAIVLDNSLSTTAVVGGAPVFDRLRAAAQAVLTAATPDDKLWLFTADGRPRAGSRDALLAELAQVTPIEGAGDLPLAFRRAGAAVQEARLPVRVVAVATDGQRTAWSAASRSVTPTSVFVPPGNPPLNRAVLQAAAEPARWTPRGSIVARVDAEDSVGYRVVIGERTVARGTAGRGEPVVLRVSPPERGWQAGRVELEPDDFRADDVRHFAVWIGSAPAVTSDASAGPFVATALSALVADGRATTGTGVRLTAADAAGQLPALIVPPADPVRLGAANRELARLGVPWRFGALDRSPSIARGGRLDGVNVMERYHLVREGVALSDTLATAGGEPWVVAGPGYVVVASRLDPAATNLPVRAIFLPWIADLLALRLGAPPGDLGAPIAAAPGAVVILPAGADALESPTGSRRSVSGDRTAAPDERGVWFILRAGRRVGALVVNAPPEESALARWSNDALASRLAGRAGRATGTPDAWVRNTFVAGTRRPAVTPLLLLALVLLAAEAIAVRTSRSTAA
jgi:hypothetical protein